MNGNEKSMKKITKIFKSFPQAVSFVENLGDNNPSLWKTLFLLIPAVLTSARNRLTYRYLINRTVSTMPFISAFG